MFRVLLLVIGLCFVAACTSKAVPGSPPGVPPDSSASPTAVAMPTDSEPTATPIAEETGLTPTEAAARVVPKPSNTRTAFTPSATATQARPSPPTPVVPISFAIAPTVTKRIGDQLSMNWEAAGEAANICPVDGTGPLINLCVKVPLSGSRTVTVDANHMGYLGYTLRISNNRVLQFVTVSVAFQCEGLRDWFFPTPPARCPQAESLSSDAVVQHFSHGLMVWLAQPDTFYVFYDGAGAPRYVEFASRIRLRPGASPNNRVGSVPDGLWEPVSNFGMIWRGEVEGFDTVRERLGWATELEFPYNAAFQCATPTHPHSWSCYLRWPDGRTVVMRPDSTAQDHFVWQEW